jgi:hypothetical protein
VQRIREAREHLEAVLAKRSLEWRSKNASKPKSPDGSSSGITELCETAAASADLDALLADLDMEPINEATEEVIEAMTAEDLDEANVSANTHQNESKTILDHASSSDSERSKNV